MLENTARSTQRKGACFISSLNGFGFQINATLEDVTSEIFVPSVSLEPNDSKLVFL
jgi:hypothetical protein